MKGWTVVVYRGLAGELKWFVATERGWFSNQVPLIKKQLRRCGTPVIAIVRFK